MANYRLPRFTADLNLTWVHTFKSFLYNESFEGNQNVPPTVDDNNGTPAITSNLVMAWQATPRLKLHTHILFEGRQKSYFVYLNPICEALRLSKILQSLDPDDPEYEEVYRMGEELEDELSIEKRIDARAILNIGADYKIGRLTLGLNVRNLLNTRYNRGGMDAPLMPQQGRWWTASVSYHF
jgi:iron complex outermembrane receptor protein